MTYANKIRNFKKPYYCFNVLEIACNNYCVDIKYKFYFNSFIFFTFYIRCSLYVLYNIRY